MTLKDFKDVFGAVKVVSPIRCWDVSTKEEVLPPLDKPVSELLWCDLIFKLKGSDVLICTSEEAFAAARSERKVMLEDVIRCKRPDFDFNGTILDWEGL